MSMQTSCSCDYHKDLISIHAFYESNLITSREENLSSRSINGDEHVRFTELASVATQ